MTAEEFDPETVNRALRNIQEHSLDQPLISRQDLKTALTQEGFQTVNAVYELDPSEHGVDHDYLGAPTPDSLQPLPKRLTSPDTTLYLPGRVLQAVKALNDEVQSNVGDAITVMSAYRTPARQSTLFLRYLLSNDCNVAATMKRVLPPGYTEHSHPERQAIDITAAKKSVDDAASFKDTKAYTYLKQHGQHHGFTESYPEDNESGLMQEPWHWRFTGDTSES